jgi:hypothetical protein
MSRYGAYFPKDTAPVDDGDTVFLGVNAKLSPEQLAPGYCRMAINKTFRRGMAATRKGTLTPVSHALPTGEVYGSGIYSDPDGSEWLLVATEDKVHQLRDGHTPRTIALPRALSAPVEFVQAFNRVLLFRGADLGPLEWDGKRTSAFMAVDQRRHADGTSVIPNGSSRPGLAPVLMNNRLFVPTGRDQIAVSDILDYTRYDAALQQFNVNEGSDDVLTALYPFVQNSMLVFKDQSILLINNIYGDLSEVTLDQINREIGCVAGRSVAMLGSDVLFLSATGVYRVQQIIQGRLQTGAVAVSDAIDPIIRRINWKAAVQGVAAVLGDYYYLAVPIDGSEANNAVLPFNTVTNAWEGIHQWPEWMRIDALHVTDWQGVKRLWAVDHDAARVHLLYEGFTDMIAGVEHAVSDRLETRGYLLGNNGRKALKRVQVTMETWRPRLDLAIRTDSTGETMVVEGLVKDPAVIDAFGESYDLINANDDHGRELREDYSADFAAPTFLGQNGIDFNRRQISLERFATRGVQGRWASVILSSERGACDVSSIQLESAEASRNTRSKL